MSEDDPLPWWIHWDTMKGCYKVRFKTDFDKIAVEHTQEMIQKDLLLDD